MDVQLAWMYQPYIGQVALSLQIAAISLVIITAVFGNSVMCYAVYRTPTLRTVTNIFTVNLGVTDMSVALVSLPVWISTLVLGATNKRDHAPFPFFLCQITSFLTVTLLLVSISTLAGISLDRYFSICHPLTYPLEVTSRRVYIALTCIWSFSILLATTPFYGWGVYTFRPQTVPICNPHWAVAPSYAGFLLVAGIALPLAIMLFSYIRIVQVARKQAKQIQQIQFKLTRSPPEDADVNPDGATGEESHSGNGGLRQIFKRARRRLSDTGSSGYSLISKNLKTLKTVFIVVGAFFLCWGPYVILTFWSVNHDDIPIPYVADLLTTLLAFSNSALNPFVFMLLNRDFRLALKTIYRRFVCCNCNFKGPPPCRDSKRRTSHCVESIQLQTRHGSLDSGVAMDSFHKDSPKSRPVPTKHVELRNKLLEGYSYDNPIFSLEEEDQSAHTPSGGEPPGPSHDVTSEESASVAINTISHQVMFIPGQVHDIPSKLPTAYASE